MPRELVEKIALFLGKPKPPAEYMTEESLCCVWREMSFVAFQELESDWRYQLKILFEDKKNIGFPIYYTSVIANYIVKVVTEPSGYKRAFTYEGSPILDATPEFHKAFQAELPLK